MKWIKMSVELDDETSGYLEKLTAYKVRQDCFNKEGGTTVHMNVTFADPSCDPITVNWLKVCGQPTITRDFLTVGLSQAGSEAAVNGMPTLSFDGNTKDDVYVVSADEDSTIFYLRMNDYYAKTYYRAPYVVSDHSVIYPVLNGTAATGGWLDNTVQTLQITYNCLKASGNKEELMLVIELPYFHDIELHFFKRCGAAAKSKATPSKWNWRSMMFQ